MPDRAKKQARLLLEGFTAGKYVFGLNVLDQVGSVACQLGDKALIIANPSPWLKPIVDRVRDSLKENGVEIVGGGALPGARPNTPREDVYRIETYILHHEPDFLIALGAGSTIDAVKAANVLATLGTYSAELDTYFGTGQVTKVLQATGKKLFPLLAIETAASSGAHLTKYSNVTDPVVGQKKLIVDDAVVPNRAVFDYTVTYHMPRSLTLDGAFDGIAHCLEVFYGATEDKFDRIKNIALTGIELIVNYTERVIEDPRDGEAREALGLGTDLGGYAIMVGGTNGAHLTSFSLVDITSHGRACAIMNPYYTVFFAPAIQRQLKLVAEILRRVGLTSIDPDQVHGRELGIEVARAMQELAKRVGFPTTLADVPGFSQRHLERALAAAKDPQLESKLKNMPVPLDASLVDKYMAPILHAAASGDFGIIKNM